jgi:hypothetical protein
LQDEQYDELRREIASGGRRVLDHEVDYPALLTIFPDGDRMPRTWAAWLKTAEEMESGLKAYGHVVMRVYIDPNTFPDWCAAHGTSPGSEGRKRFVAEAVTERYGKQN